MAFTDHSDFFGSVHDEGIQRVVRHVMRQRPSLFNYATAVFHQRPELLCEKIVAAEKVVEAGNPLFTEVEPLPVLGTPVPMGLNFCLQLTDAQLDFHPADKISLPPELRPLAEQSFALRARGCLGIDCPNRELLDELTRSIEATLLAEQELAIGRVEEDEDGPSSAAAASASRAAGAYRRRFPTVHPGIVALLNSRTLPRDEGTFVLPTRDLICFCLEIVATGHFEWGDVIGSQQRWLKPKLDGIEIVDLEPKDMENSIECYLATLLRLGVLPRLMVPAEKMVLDITSQTAAFGLELGKQVSLVPAQAPAEVLHNPAIEANQLKVFINLEITDLGA